MRIIGISKEPSMEMLQIIGHQIATAQGQPVQLRGVCLGGWMNMESFIDGYPGTEQGLRGTLAAVLGENKATFFFERWLDYFCSEADIAFLQDIGINAIRLPLNYRHFESDLDPFHYDENGFRRLDEVVTWCARHSVYAILDLHAAQGWQNPDWHCDNPTHQALFWTNSQYQDRFVALWQEIARRYKGNHAIAGYDILNEPLTNTTSDLIFGDYRPDWERINAVYRRVVQTIRKIDPDHIIFLEGDGFSSRYMGLETPFADNLSYSFHFYDRPGWGPGPYPGMHKEGYWDRAKLVEVIGNHEATRFTREHQVPLWAGEFGSVYNGAVEDRSDRLRGLADTIDVFEEFGAHWTLWTYKDVGVMGLVWVHPESEYMQRLALVLDAKLEFHTDSWMYWLPSRPGKGLLGQLAQMVQARIGEEGRDAKWIEGQLTRASLAGVVGTLLQPVYANVFKGLSEVEIDRVLQSFALSNCLPNQEAVDILRTAVACPLKVP